MSMALEAFYTSYTMDLIRTPAKCIHDIGAVQNMLEFTPA
jgi:hypothetical protein